MDGDGAPNHVDTDADADGLPDAEEGLADADLDGVPDYLERGEIGYAGGALCAAGAPLGRTDGAHGGAALLSIGFALRVRRVPASAVQGGRGLDAHPQALRIRSRAGLAACALGAAASARAQGTTLDRFSPAETVRDGFYVSRPNDLGHLRFGFDLVADYANDPLVLELDPGNLPHRGDARGQRSARGPRRAAGSRPSSGSCSSPASTRTS